MQPLSIGAVYDWSPGGRRWRDAVTRLGNSVIAARSSTDSDLSLNVVFHIGGRRIEPDFVGVRTGLYSERKRLLKVEAAVPSLAVADESVDADQVLRDLLKRAVAEGASFARLRGIATDLGSLERLASEV